MERYLMSTYTGVRNFQKTVQFLAHPVDILKMCWHIKNEVSRLKLSKAKARTVQTDRKTQPNALLRIIRLIVNMRHQNNSSVCVSE